ncbi:hypothetical protein A5761_13780 [Mycolicibacterium setense]|nr:hypothetical protein A5761_13780 [Mycolicibacterium setense]
MLAIGAALTTAACGGASSSIPSTVTVTASATQSTKESGQQEYPSVQALAIDLTKYGHRCVVTPRGPAQNATESGECWIDGKEAILTIYPNQAGVDQYLEMIHGIMDLGSDPYGWLVGNKWIINCGNREFCETLAASLGGTVDAR